MKNDIKNMLNKTLIYDIVIALTLSTIINLTVNLQYSFIFFLGLVVSYSSFYFNAFSTNYALESKKKLPKLIITLSFIFRVIFVGILGIILFTYNKFYVLAYIFGYSSHFVSILIYGLTLREE